MIKYKILYIGAIFKNTNEVWGGSVATNYVFKKSFLNHDKYEIIFIKRTEIKNIEDFLRISENNKHDILHVDDVRILTLLFNNDISPDIIGPIVRSPIKIYGDWKSEYTEDYFYKSKIIRLNRSEEYLGNGKIDYTDKIIYINHGIDTNLLYPSENKNKKYILWAGDKNRKAKGYEMWVEIQEKTLLPNNYEFKTLTNYAIEDYWNILNDTKILINTSLNESFCCAMFEAKSKGIPTIYKKNLHNGRHLDGRIQVDYNADSYNNEIIKLLSDNDYYEQESKLSRTYTIENFSLSKMAETYSSVYDLILKEKNI